MISNYIGATLKNQTRYGGGTRPERFNIFSITIRYTVLQISRKTGYGPGPNRGSRTRIMDDKERLLVLLDHWIGHNEDHVSTYRDWADRMRACGEPAVADLLDGAAEREEALVPLFTEARGRLSDQSTVERGATS